MAETLTVLQPVIARVGVPRTGPYLRRELKRDFESLAIRRNSG